MGWPFIGLVILASGIGILVFGITKTHEVTTLFQLPILQKGDPIFIGIGAALSVFGTGMVILSIIWNRK